MTEAQLEAATSEFMEGVRRSADAAVASLKGKMTLTDEQWEEVRLAFAANSCVVACNTAQNLAVQPHWNQVFDHLVTEAHAMAKAKEDAEK